MRLGFILLLTLFSTLSGASRPNVLFIIVDDLTTTLGCYGNAQVRTPGMDALAERGVRFEHAYTQFALCNPSRCSFLTGCYPEKTGVMDLKTSLRKALPEVVTLPPDFAEVTSALPPTVILPSAVSASVTGVEMMGGLPAV